MQTITAEDFARQAHRMLTDAPRGECTVVTDRGNEVLLVVPLKNGSPDPGTLLDIAAQLYDKEMISLERAARIAGLSYSQTIDEFGQRGVATIRLNPEELDRELASFRR